MELGRLWDGRVRGARVRAVLFWAALVPAPVWALVRVFGWESGWLRDTPATQVVAFTPYAAVASVGALGLAVVVALRRVRRRGRGRAAVAREWCAVGAALAASVALLCCVVPRAIGP